MARPRRRAIGGVPRNFKPAPLTLEEAVRPAKDAGYRDADDVADGIEPLNGSVYVSEEAYSKAQGGTTPEIARAAVAAYREGWNRFSQEYGEPRPLVCVCVGYEGSAIDCTLHGSGPSARP